LKRDALKILSLQGIIGGWKEARKYGLKGQEHIKSDERILGEKVFIKEALSRLKEGVVSRKETSHRRLLESTYQPDVIVNTVSVFFGIDNKEILMSEKSTETSVSIL